MRAVISRPKPERVQYIADHSGQFRICDHFYDDGNTEIDDSIDNQRLPDRTRKGSSQPYINAVWELT